MHDDTGNVVDGDGAGVALDAHVLEPMRRVARFEHGAAAVGHDDVDLSGVQQLLRDPVDGRHVVHRDVASLVERFAVGEGDLGIARAMVARTGSNR